MFNDELQDRMVILGYCIKCVFCIPSHYGSWKGYDCLCPEPEIIHDWAENNVTYDQRNDYMYLNDDFEVCPRLVPR